MFTWFLFTFNALNNKWWRIEWLYVKFVEN